MAILLNLVKNFVDPKYRDLAWRIINQILPTQKYKLNISKSAKCYLCKRSVETLTHLFYECPMLNELWNFVESVLFQLIGCQVKVSIKAILFNIFKPHAITRFNELLMLLVNGSFHVKSSDFWPFFHGPPPILLKFGTLVELV